MRTIYIRKGNIKIMGIPEERRKRSKELFKEIITEFSKPGEGNDVYIHEASITSNYISAENLSKTYYIKYQKSVTKKKLKRHRGKKE